MAQIQLYYLIQQSNLIQQSHILNSVKNSIVWSRLHYHLISTVLFIQHCYKFSCINCLISFYILIYFNSRTYSILSQIQLYIYFAFISPSTAQTYSKVSQIHLSYPNPQSNLIKQYHILNSVTNSIVWSRFTFSSCSTVPFIQQFANSLVFSNFTLISHS